jgi:hypothetical protein
MTASITSPSVPRPRLWFGLFGGALAWLVHLVGASIAAEWGCVAGLDRWQLLGVSAVAWLVIAISVLTLLAAAGATWSAYHVNRHYHDAAGHQRDTDAFDEHGTDVYMARTGLWTSGLFVFIIAAESIPVLYFLTECG